MKIINKGNPFLFHFPKTHFTPSCGNWLTVDMSKLKYKELDGLEAIFRLWRNDEGITVDIVNSWNNRVEQLLQQRTQNKVSYSSSTEEVQENAVRQGKLLAFRVRSFLCMVQQYKNVCLIEH